MFCNCQTLSMLPVRPLFVFTSNSTSGNINHTPGTGSATGWANSHIRMGLTLTLWITSADSDCIHWLVCTASLISLLFVAYGRCYVTSQKLMLMKVEAVVAPRKTIISPSQNNYYMFAWVHDSSLHRVIRKFVWEPECSNKTWNNFSPTRSVIIHI